MYILICIVWLNYIVLIYANNKAYIVEDEAQKKTNRSTIEKVILIWYFTENFLFQFRMANQSNIFTKIKCLHSNCHLTYDRDYLHDVSNFDAIVFHGRDLNEYDLPLKRSYHQKYIFFNVESPYYFPVCSKRFDGYFNWTSTYRLDSDIPNPYMQIRDRYGTIVGPKDNITWTKSNTSKVEKSEIDQLRRKKISAAFWLVSNCRTVGRREIKISELRTVLHKVGLRIDLYGYCGWPLINSEEDEVQRYYFQLAFENSICKDYATEKLTKAWKYSAIPVVYGGANYTRFLPPGSYIDASQLSAQEVARRMRSIVENKELFMEYYEWKLFYSYKSPSKDIFCSLCAALHNETMMKWSSHTNFRKWWNLKAEYHCRRNTQVKYYKKDDILHSLFSRIRIVLFIILILLISVCILKKTIENVKRAILLRFKM